MVEEWDDKAVPYVNSNTGFGSLWLVEVVDVMINISNTDMEEGHRQPTINHTTYMKIDQSIPIHPLDLVVKT